MSQVKANAKKINLFQILRTTIATKLTIWFLVLSLAPLVVFFVFVLGNIDQQFVDMTTQNAYEQTRLLGTEISLLDNTDSIKTLFIQNYIKECESFLVGINETNVVYFGDKKRFDEIYGKFPAEIINQIQIKNDGIFVDNRKWAVAFYRVPGKEFIVITFADLSDTLSPLNQIEATGFIQIGATLFIAAIISGIFIFLTMKPIKNLVKSIEKIRTGNLDIRIDLSKFEGELETLAIGFDQMINDLKKSHEQIEKHAQELELKVQGRTKELDERVSELSTTKTAVLNMMDDMDEANKELIKMQEELKKSLEELRLIDVRKDEFISIAAHELKTPLTSIHGFSQLLLDMDMSKNSEKRNKYLKIIDSETKRVARLVTDILDLSRIDLGTVKLSPEEVDVKALVENVQREMNVQITEKGLKSEYVLGPDIPKIVTDKERLTQILLNLINNAVKYTPKGKITVQISKEENDVHFMIKDTGIGIAKEHYDKLFHRFYQIDSSYTRRAGGTGLGLALCKEFIDMMGGKIWFTSEFGKGSEFHFTLPIKNAADSKIKDAKTRAEDVLKKSDDVVRKTKI